MPGGEGLSAVPCPAVPSPVLCPNDMQISALQLAHASGKQPPFAHNKHGHRGTPAPLSWLQLPPLEPGILRLLGTPWASPGHPRACSAGGEHRAPLFSRWLQHKDRGQVAPRTPPRPHSLPSGSSHCTAPGPCFASCRRCRWALEDSMDAQRGHGHRTSSRHLLLHTVLRSSAHSHRAHPGHAAVITPLPPAARSWGVSSKGQHGTSLLSRGAIAQKSHSSQQQDVQEAPSSHSTATEGCSPGKPQPLPQKAGSIPAPCRKELLGLHLEATGCGHNPTLPPGEEMHRKPS